MASIYFNSMKTHLVLSEFFFTGIEGNPFIKPPQYVMLDLTTFPKLFCNRNNFNAMTFSIPCCASAERPIT